MNIGQGGAPNSAGNAGSGASLGMGMPGALGKSTLGSQRVKYLLCVSRRAEKPNTLLCLRHIQQVGQVPWAFRRGIRSLAQGGLCRNPAPVSIPSEAEARLLQTAASRSEGPFLRVSHKGI